MRFTVTAGAAGSVSTLPRMPRVWTGSGVPPSDLGFAGDQYERSNGDYYRKTSAGWGTALFNRTGPAGADASGDVVGPASAVNNRIALFDGTTGKLLKDGGKGLPSGTLVGTSDTQTLSNKSLAADPSSAMHPVTKQYVDGLAQNLGKRSRPRVATTGNVTIATAVAPGETIDGVTLAAGDLVLVRAQTSPAENGLYVAAIGLPPARAPEFDTYDEHPGTLLAVAEGTTLADTVWLCTSNAGGTLDTTAIVFAQQRVSGELLAANNLSDLASPATAQTNLGGTTVGKAVFTAVDAAAARTAISAAAATHTHAQSDITGLVTKLTFLEEFYYSGISAEAKALQEALYALGTPMSFARLTSIDTILISPLIADGVWERLDALYVLAAHSREAARVNLISPGTYTASEVDTANLSFVVDEGFAGNGSSSYLETGINPALGGFNFVQDDGSLFVWSLTDSDDGSADIGSGTLTRVLSRSGGNLVTRGNAATSGTTAVADSLGLSGFSRDASDHYDNIKGASVAGSPAIASTGISSANIRICAASTVYSTRRLAIAGIGRAVAPVLSELHTAASAWLTSIGAI